MSTNLQDVLDYIRAEATDADMQRVVATSNERLALLRSQRAVDLASSLKPGDKVELAGVRPKYLAGLRGEFVDTKADGRKVLAVVKLNTTDAFTAARFVNHNGEMRVPLSALVKLP